jgi:hypothetical protein
MELSSLKSTKEKNRKSIIQFLRKGLESAPACQSPTFQTHRLIKIQSYDKDKIKEVITFSVKLL